MIYPRLALRLHCIMLPLSMLSSAVCLAQEAPSAADLEFFESQVRPILVARCYECHSSDAGEPAGGLRIDLRSGWRTGGDSGPAINSTEMEESLLVRAIRYDWPELQMPPKSRLPQREINILEEWVHMGAPAPDDPEDAEGAGPSKEFNLIERRDSHWAWQPVAPQAPPAVEDTAWPRDDVDRFVLARLEEEGLRPAPRADRYTWLRRITFDLTGLPPTREEIGSFIADKEPGAEERVVDRLLATVSFGEAWASHWLDLVRFSETKGHEQDYEIPNAWRYRDYVIRALNANVPYDQFVREHVEGDLMESPRLDPETGANQSVQGTGFWYLGEATHSPVDIRGDEAERVSNQIDVFSKTFLGMTVACARCHDHKFDAISAADYYAIAGFLQSTGYRQANVADPRAIDDVVTRISELNSVTTNDLLAAYREMTAPRLQAFAADLTAASSPSDGERPDDEQQDAERIAALREELAKAKESIAHPLHAVAIAAAAAEEAPPLAQRLEAIRSAGQRRSPRSVVVRFADLPAKPGHDDWITSGVSFGQGPTAVGDILFDSADPCALSRVVETPAATSLFAGEKLTGMYRTRTFTGAGDSLWYRYRGEADVFVAVDSHRTVYGPLHTVLQQKISSPDKVSWFRHDVSDYRDHGMHVEFTPIGEFELLEVCFADGEPTEAAALNGAVCRRLEEQNSSTAEGVINATVNAMSDAIHALGGETSPDDAKIVNWLLESESLLPPADSKCQAEFAAICQRYRAQRTEIEAEAPSPEWAIAMLDGPGENEYVHLRGSHKRLAEQETPRNFLTALDGELTIPEGSGRDLLADRIVDPENPLTARVMVNRVWGHLVGRAIAPTVDNFGVLGVPPTHPELLDYLAAEFVESGWDAKALIRRIALSSTYAESSEPDADVLEKDPSNRLFHSARVRRVSAESVRDALLAVSGELDRKHFGPSVRVNITDFMRHNRSPSWTGPLDGDLRRSIYIEVRRNALDHFLAAFDKPAPFSTVGRRNESNSAAQPLMLLNDPFVHERADKWAESLTSRFETDAEAIRDAYLTAFGREVTPDEAARITGYIRAFTDADSAPDARQRAWEEVCLSLVNVKQFVFLN